MLLSIHEIEGTGSQTRIYLNHAIATFPSKTKVPHLKLTYKMAIRKSSRHGHK